MDIARPIPDEERFLAFALEGDARSLEELLRAHADSAYTQARRLLGNGGDADDAVQEAFLQLARGAKRYDPAIPFRAWLGRLVHIAALRVRRADRRRERHQREAASRKREATVMDEDFDHELVRRAVADLPESYRAPIDLHYFAGLSQGETARALGVSENAVAVRIHRGRERLRKALGGMQPGSAGVAAALASCPSYAAPAATTAHAATVAAWATSGTLPATTVKLGLVQQGAWLMSQHPLASCAIVAVIASAALVAPLAHAADGRLPGAPSSHAQAQAALVAADGASATCWTGRAAQLLPFVDGDAATRFGVDADALRAAAATAPPPARLVDPRLARTVAHVRRMIAAWSLQVSGVPVLRMFDAAHGAVMSLRSDSVAGRPVPSGLFLADVGSAADPLRAYIESKEVEQRNSWVATPGNSGLKPYQPITIGAFVGSAAGDEVVAFDGERFVGASLANLRRAIEHPSQPLPRWRDAPLWLEQDLAPLIASLPRGLDPLLRLAPGLASPKPTMAIAVSPRSDGWSSRVSITVGARPRLGAIGPVGAGALASAKLAGLAVAFASGQDLGTVVSSCAGSDVLAGLEPVFGTCLSGEVAVCVDPGATIPTLSLVAALAPDADMGAVARLIDPILRRLGAAPSDASAPETRAWSAMSPFGQVSIVIAADRLVVTTATDRKPLLARGAAMDDALSAHADLAALGRAFLPLLYARVPVQPVWLSSQAFPRAIQNMGMLRDNFVIAIVQDGGKSVGALATAKTSGFGPMSEDLRKALGEGAGAADIDAAVALFSDWNLAARDFNGSHRALLYRLEDGWHEARFDADRNRPSPAMTAEQASKLVAGLRQISGAPLDRLKPIPLPELATFDRRWLPDIAAVCDHLPEWRLSARATGYGLVIQERGVPLIGLAGMTLPIVAPSIAVRSDGPPHASASSTPPAPPKRDEF